MSSIGKAIERSSLGTKKARINRQAVASARAMKIVATATKTTTTTKTVKNISGKNFGGKRA